MTSDNSIKIILLGIENERLYLILEELIHKNSELQEFV